MKRTKAKTKAKAPVNGDFERLVVRIGHVHDTMRRCAIGSVNTMLTFRNWLVGMYIVEYEQKGEDRARYGERLIRLLAGRLSQQGIKGMSFTSLNLCRQLYRTYPQIVREVSRFIHRVQGHGSGFPIIQKSSEQLTIIAQSVAVDAVKGDVASPGIDVLLKHFSFSHFVELLRIDDPLKRAFYEIEGINGCWSVPQLKRQIESQLYERTGLSKKKAAVVAAAHKQNAPSTIEDAIRDPYILEFTGLPERAYYSETDLETALPSEEDIRRFFEADRGRTEQGLREMRAGYIKKL